MRTGSHPEYVADWRVLRDRSGRVVSVTIGYPAARHQERRSSARQPDSSTVARRCGPQRGQDENTEVRNEREEGQVARNAREFSGVVDSKSMYQRV